MVRTARRAAVVVLLPVATQALAQPTRPSSPAPPRPHCLGHYADDFAALSVRARELDQSKASYTFCVRTRAVYECPYYGSDGALRRNRKTAVAHGTAFAYQRRGGGTLLLTNQHVADWPAVTDAEHRVEDVPLGCRRVSDSLEIVDNDSDRFEEDDVPLTRVVSDERLDVAVLKAPRTLPVMPWKIGRSERLRVRNAVNVRGFPLGVFKATHVGKVVSIQDHDEHGEWDHDDFVIDALLSAGNSGSPVLAISCETGEFELVGIYHADYSSGSALNVVVGIDQVRPLMTTLRVAPRPRGQPDIAMDGTGRRQLTAALTELAEPLFFPFGGLTARLTLRSDGAFVYRVEHPRFPLDSRPIAVLEDLPATGGFGLVGRIWLGNARGLKVHEVAALDGETQNLAVRLMEALRKLSLVAHEYQRAAHDSRRNRAAFQRAARLEKAVREAASAHRELGQSLGELAERLGPGHRDAARPLAEAYRPLTPAPVPAASGPAGERAAGESP
jgi:serine protease Do